MNKKIMSIALAVGCVASNAAMNNYDLLGRKGSKMNSPMVYRNVDYSKFKKEQPQKMNSPLAKTALNKQGLAENIAAIEGSYEPKMGGSHPIYFKRYYSSNSVDVCQNEIGDNNHSSHCMYEDIADNNLYLKRLNTSFIPTSRNNVNPSNYERANKWTNASSSEYELSLSNGSFSNPTQPSPYEYNQTIQYKSFYDVKRYNSKRRLVEWWFDGVDNPSSSYYEEGLASDVGVYLAVDALPVKMDPNKNVDFIRHTASDQFNTYIGYEMLASKTYSVVKDASKRSVVYVGEGSPASPADRTPQIYVGVHNRKGVNNNSSATPNYTSTAKALDNYIYNNRTVEIVAAGNFGTKNNANAQAGSGNLAAEAHAANAITVGAVDAVTQTITNYNSYNKAANGVKKPEIFNFSHFYMSDKKRSYKKKSTGTVSVYEPYYDGAEMSAAYTAGMVSDLLSINPFYRWHPEVVKALMITSSHVELNSPYPYSPYLRKVPSYYGLVFDNALNAGANAKDFYHYSRYWIGDVNKLKTRINSKGQKEIWFSYANVPGRDHVAAIAWLSSGNDIANLGHIPQDFDLYVYPSNSSTPNVDNPGTAIGSSTNGRNSFEKVAYNTDASYVTFCIRLYSEDAATENPNQIVLGFDVASFE